MKDYRYCIEFLKGFATGAALIIAGLAVALLILFFLGGQ